ncbi:S-4TM family putative pore-forming effector [Amycolatopsis sp. A133]|uniref:S-4TM family putative pore-forming effector n=1 Tax=Amycolatopsis sp. A133 TaxID=3064472 RepID=UPI0027FCF6A4|nr:S-4TM family putative pore-forming effector [Amycolatopsis sp. A133]MDQ7808259.1 S-4TM family putative pore-forming effector [Amycolatopsis sp. A133]
MSEPPPLFTKADITPAQLTALKAMSISHQRVRILSGLRIALSSIIAVSGAVVTVTTLQATWVTIVGALWAAIYSIGLASWVDGELLRAAKLQEKFEVELFRLPWNTVVAGRPVRMEDASRLSNGFKGRRIAEDWDEMPKLPRPFDVLARQIQNLGWGSRIRRRYANVVLFFVSTWTALGVVIGASLSLTVTDIVVRWFIPSLGGLLLGLDTFRQQRAVASDRERVCVHAEDEAINAAAQPDKVVDHDRLLILARQVQDTLFSTRCRAPRAPSRIFYLPYYSSDSIDFKAPVQRIAEALPSAPTD